MLNDELKVAYTMIGTLTERVCALEKTANDHIRLPLITPIVSNPNSNPEKTLLLGDANINEINSYDLGKNTFIRTLKGASIDKMKIWIEKKLAWAPSTCVIYGGTSDVNENTPAEKFLDSLGALVSKLKQKSENMNIYICQLVPNQKSDLVQVKFNDLNENISKWCDGNGISFIETDSLFRFQTGDINDLCFYDSEECPNPIFNRLGAIRLLTAFDKYCPSFTPDKYCPSFTPDKYCPSFTPCDNWERNKASMKLKLQHTQHISKTLHTGFSLTSTNTHRTFRSQFHAPNTQTHFELNSRPPYLNKNTEDSETSTTQPRHDRLHTRIFTTSYNNSNANADTHHRPSTTTTSSAHSTSHHRTPTYFTTGTHNNTEHHTSPHATSNVHTNTQYRRKIGCFNCGKFNHRQSTCRFDHKLKCEICHSYGHKSRLCSYYSSY